MTNININKNYYNVVLEYLFNELKQSAMRKSRSRKKVPSFIVFLFYCGSLLSLLINDIANKANHFTIRDWPFPMHSPRHNTGNNVVCMSYHYYSLEAIWTNIFGQITTTNVNSRGDGTRKLDQIYSLSCSAMQRVVSKKLIQK